MGGLRAGLCASARGGEWPRIEDLQRQLAIDGHEVSVRAVWMQASDFVAIVSPDQRVRLTLHGLATVPAARPTLDGYVRLVQAIVRRYRDSDAEARFESADLAELALDPAVEQELALLLADDNWPLGSGSRQEDGSWSYEITDMALVASRVTTIEELVAARYGEPYPQDESQEPLAEPLTTEPGRAASVHADQPITTPEEDLLGRARLAQTLAEQATAAEAGQGFVMAICGEWGSGKTSLLNLVAATVQTGKSGHVVRFDPWLFSSSEELVLRFLREMSAQLERGQGSRNGRAMRKVASAIGDYAQTLAPLAAPTPVPWLTMVMQAPGGLLKHLGRRGSVSAEQQREAVRGGLRRLDRRVVVLIDDLDRLEVAEIRDVVRLVKLVGDFPNTTYVLAYDQSRVAQALGDGNPVEGGEFLEKIVQLSYDLPPIAPETLTRLLGGAISDAVGDISRYQFDATAYQNVTADGMRALFATIRDVRRYANALPPTLALVGDEIELTDVLALEALRVLVPGSFRLLIASKDALTAPRDGMAASQANDAAARQQLTAIIEAAGDQAEPVTGIIRRLFPAAQRHLGGSSYGSDWQAAWRRGRRVAHPEVFDIYINQALPSGVLPAALVDRAFTALQDADAIASLLDSLNSDELAVLLERVEHYEQDFPTEHVEIPVAALYQHRGRLREHKRHVFDLGEGHRIARVVLRLLRRLDPAEVARVTRAAAREVRPLSDRGELIRLVGYREDSGHKLVTEADANQLEAEFFDRLLRTDAAQLLDERDVVHLLLWAKEHEPLATTALVQRMVEDDELLPGLLRRAMTEIVGQTTGDAAVRRHHQLNWTALVALATQDHLAQRVNQLDATGIEDELTAQAVREAQRYAADPSAADEQTMG